MINHCFIVTSAINTRFGIYSATQRLTQTLSTIESIKQRVPSAKIVLVEMAGIPLTSEQTAVLIDSSDVLLDYTDELAVQARYSSTDNWDIVKNGTEIMVFGSALKLLRESEDFAQIDRIHKVSGRYCLNNLFDPSTYEQTQVLPKIVVAARRKSQFSSQLTGQREQYMSRLWSWPVELLDEVIEFYDTALVEFDTTISKNQYIDIEHLLCKLLPPADIHELQHIGVEGTIGPNGTAVKD